ncbi:MAG: hypothetical protein ACI9CD_000102 [Candidatus Deianiraeaceae bacterium]|jgi:hypothetical protein
MPSNSVAVIIYVITNNFMRDEGGKLIIKIGFTAGSKQSDLEKRLQQLYSTGVPDTFICNYAIVVEDKKVEKLLHNIFADYRINPNREFFNMSLKTVKSALLLSGARFIINCDEDDDESTIDDTGKISQPKQDKNTYSFEDLGITKGSQLTYKKDSSIVCYTDDNKKVIYEGEKYSLSGLVTYLLRKDANNHRYVGGWTYFMHNGKTLYDIWKEKCSTC